MRSGRLHIAGVSTGPTPIAVNCAGYVPFAIMGTQRRHLRLRDGNHRAGRQHDQDAGRPQGQEGGVHRADLELGLQGALGHSGVRLQPQGRARLHAGVLRQARQLGARRRQQGLRRRRDRQRGDGSHVRPQGGGQGARSGPSTSPRPSRPRATASRTISIRTLADKIKEAFFSFPWEGSTLKAEFKTENRFVPITYQKDWSVIRKIDAVDRRQIHLQVTFTSGGAT